MDNKNFVTVELIAKKIDRIVELREMVQQIDLLLCINGERNIGKSTCWLHYFFDENRVSESRKIGVIRNSKEQIDSFKKDFNAYYKNRYQIIGNLIWRLEEQTIEVKGEEVKQYKPEEHIGYVGSISTFVNLKSVRAKDVRYIFYDEYNEELTQKGVYKKFINLITTLGRFNKLLIVMVGNRDTPNNEYMVKWDILPEEEQFKEDRVIEFDNNCFFIELGTKQFKNLGNDDTIWKRLGSFDKDTDRYLNGGYASDSTLFVIPYSRIKESFNPLFMLAVNGRLLALGEFKHWKWNEELMYCLAENDDAIEKAKKEKLKVYSLDSLGYQLKETIMNDSDSMYNMIRVILLAHKNCKMYYDGFDVMSDIQDKMIQIKF